LFERDRAPKAAQKMQISVKIPVQPEAVAMARDTVSRVVAERQADQRTVEDLRLLTREVVTNALRHSGMRPGGSLTVAVDIERDRVRIGVTDDGPGFDPDDLPGPSPDNAGGWGLLLVEQLADTWGVARDGSTFVWFELEL
jgi:anti-sigma regulatory factor (Ser/Thr protein kinase)